MFALAFVNGLLAAFAALVIELVFLAVLPGNVSLSGTIGYDSSLGLILAAAAIEEISKSFFVLRTFLDRKTDRARFLKAVPLVGIAFFLIELLFKRSYLSSETALPFLGVLLIHLATVLIFASAISRNPDRKLRWLAALAINIVIHLAYNVAIANLS